MKLYCILIILTLMQTQQAHAETYPFLGSWDCGVGTFIFTSIHFNNGQNTFNYKSVERDGNSYLVTFRGGYRISLLNVRGSSMRWASPESGDDYECHKINSPSVSADTQEATQHAAGSSSITPAARRAYEEAAKQCEVEYERKVQRIQGAPPYVQEGYLRNEASAREKCISFQGKYAVQQQQAIEQTRQNAQRQAEVDAQRRANEAAQREAKEREARDRAAEETQELAAGPPRRDVVKRCEGLAGISVLSGGIKSQSDIPAAVEECINTEQNSYNRLKSMWKTLDEGVRAECGTAGIKNWGLLGYTGILDCVERLNEQKRTEHKLEDIENNNKFKY